MIVCLILKELDGFRLWLQACEARKEQFKFNLIWSDFRFKVFELELGYWLVFLELYFYVPNVLPKAFFKWIIRKSLMKENITVEFLTLKKGVGVLLGSKRSV